jgi:hypothetical protein
LGWSQPFGRFGYSTTPSIPGFDVFREGFSAKYEGADKLYFGAPADEWRVISLNPTEQLISLGKTGSCDLLRVNLYSPGFLVHFPKKFSLKLRTNLAPYLSWTEASVGSGVPTPKVRWIGVSFQDNQPPLVLGFLDGEASLQVDGKVADWEIHSTSDYTGWVRIALPLGTQPFATGSAASLGQFSMAVAASGNLWPRAVPVLKDFRLQDDDTALEATWIFDDRDVIVPVGAALANLGDYPLTIKSSTRRLPGSNEEGPVTISEEAHLTIRFPMDRVPLGRAITVGSSKQPEIGTVSAFDVSGVTELAFENLLASRELFARKTAEETVRTFIQEASYSPEPFTGQQLPFGTDGKGIDVSAANALLFQSYASSSKSNSSDNSLLTSVSWRRDWYTWRLAVTDQKLQRRAGALFSLAAALCPEPIRRLEGAMTQAGLAAERGLAIYFARQRHEIEEPPFFESLYEERNTIYEMTQQPREVSPFAETWLGGLRIYGDLPVSCESAEGAFRLEWQGENAPTGFTLASAFPITVESATVTNLDWTHFLGYTRIAYQSAFSGNNTLTFQIPDGVAQLPKFVAPSRYTEGLR